ncbi:MAG: hypothetical protein ABJA98_30290 [Acidobacteriota bacterium]
MRVALGIVLALATPLAAGAQNPNPNAGTAEPYTPAPNAKDLRSVIFHWMWGMGMLKGHDERDMVATLEYQGKGTIQVDGQPCTLTKYRESTNFQTFSQRTQYTCTRANGQTASNIEVVSGLYAWNEDTRGAEIGPTKGKATPMPSAVQERLVRIWASPQGAAKSALAGTTETFWLGANPGTLFADGLAKVGQTSLAWEGAKPVLTFPLPAIPGATATATLDAKYMTEKVVVTQGSTTTEFTYSNYQDWNSKLNKIGVLYAGKLVERRGNTVVRDLTTDVTETGNVYVVAPVPASVKAAIKPTGQLPKGVFARSEPPVDKSIPTPRLGAHPDLTGNYQFSDWIGNYMTGGGRRCGPTQGPNCSRQTNQTEDFELYSPSRFGNLNRPMYKPEHWDKVQELDMWTNKFDPVMTCQPLGIPRQGPPRRIFQSDKDITFLYSGGDAGGGYPEFRVIPTDGRQHGPNAKFELMYLGDTVGHWEGDTLVLDAIGFIDTTWLGRGGFFHSEKMHVVEKFTRQGNVLLYDVTVEDPEVLVEPYVYPTRVVRPSANPNAGLLRERGNCETSFETEAAATQIRH